MYHKLLVWRLRFKKTINVVFFASSVSMWRYQHLYEFMSKNSRFKPYIVISPLITYSKQQQNDDVEKLITYFNQRKLPYLLHRNTNGEKLNLREELAPDILFYSQPYNGIYSSNIAFNTFYDKLLCYIPYAFWISRGGWSYDQPLHRLAWKLFYPTALHLKDARKYSNRKGENMEIVGYPTADEFLRDYHENVWKSQSSYKKRLIWAPHFSIFSGGIVKQSNFLWMADFMLNLTQKYSNILQFVFKPHPRLLSELCKHPDWGENLAKEYYRKWEEMDNTQIETGEFVDLFMTSDAMIHDCGSFAVEYHYSGNPVMYIAENFDEQVAEKNDFGKIAMNLHYVGKCKQDIIDFIENVVLAGEDPLKPQRQQFLEDYLIPPHGKTVAENTMDVLLRELC